MEEGSKRISSTIEGIIRLLDGLTLSAAGGVLDAVRQELQEKQRIDATAICGEHH